MPGLLGLDYGDPQQLEDDQQRLTGYRTADAQQTFDALTAPAVEEATAPLRQAAAQEQAQQHFDTLTQPAIAQARQDVAQGIAQAHFAALTQPHIDAATQAVQDAASQYSAPPPEQAAPQEAAPTAPSADAAPPSPPPSGPSPEDLGNQAPDTTASMAATEQQYQGTRLPSIEPQPSPVDQVTSIPADPIGAARAAAPLAPLARAAGQAVADVAPQVATAPGDLFSAAAGDTPQGLAVPASQAYGAVQQATNDVTQQAREANITQGIQLFGGDPTDPAQRAATGKSLENATTVAMGAETSGPLGLETAITKAPAALDAATAARETVGEAFDRILASQQKGVIPPPPSTEIEKALGSLGTRVDRYLFDQNAPMKTAQDIVYKALGRAPTPAEDLYAQVRLYAGRADAAAQQVKDGLLPAIQGLTPEQLPALNAYLAAADNADKAASVANRVQLDALDKAGTGLVDQAIALPKATAAGQQAAQNRLFSGGVHAHDLPAVDAELTARYGPEGAQKIQQAAQGVWGFTQAMRDRLAQAGVISQEMAQDWATQFPHYVKADILKYLPENGGAGFSSSRPVATLADTGIKALTEEGTTAARDLPLNSVIRQAFAVESIARRNEAAQAVLAMRDASPELQQLLTKRLPDTPLTQQPGQTAFSVFVDGQRQDFVGPKLLEGVFRLDPIQVPDAVRAAATIMGAPLLRAGATGVNALFLPTNALRDAQMYMLRTGGYSSLRGAATSAAELGRAYWDSFVRGGGADWAQALKAGAGQTSEFSGASPGEILRRLTGEGALGGRIRPVTNLRDFLGATADVVGLPFTPIRALGEAAERAPRLAAYRLATQAGLQPERAALAARDVTLDFSRGGLMTKLINTFIPFFNVGVQSPERFFRYDVSPARRLQTGIGLVTGMALPIAAAEAWNRSQYPADYANVPNYLKDTGTVIMLPLDPAPNPDGSPGQRPYLWIPQPQEYSFLGTIQKQAMAAALGDDTRRWGDVFQSVVGNLSPVGADTGGVAAKVLPPLPKTAFELASNYDTFRGRQIVPDSLRNLPPGQQATASTSALGRAIGGTFNVPPAKVDYAATSLLGGVGRQLLAGSDAVARAFGAPAAQVAHPAAVDVPVVGGLAGSILRNQGGQTEEAGRQRLDAEQQQAIAAQQATVRATAGYQRLTPAQQQMVDRTIANRVAAQYDQRRKALSAVARRPTGPTR